MADELPKVLLTCTTTGQLRGETVASIMTVARDPRASVDLRIINDRPYDSALNRIAKGASASDAEWWLHIDSDQDWRGNPVDALSAGYSFVAFPAPIYRGSGMGPGAPIMQMNCWSVIDPEDWARVMPVTAQDRYTRADIVGTGSFMVELFAFRELAVESPFSREYDLDGIATRGPDVAFCKRWAEAGGLIHVDFGCVCGHHQVVDLLQVMQDMMAIQQQPAKAPNNGQPRIVRPGLATP